MWWDNVIWPIISGYAFWRIWVKTEQWAILPARVRVRTRKKRLLWGGFFFKDRNPSNQHKPFSFWLRNTNQQTNSACKPNWKRLGGISPFQTKIYLRDKTFIHFLLYQRTMNSPTKTDRLCIYCIGGGPFFRKDKSWKTAECQQVVVQRLLPCLQHPVPY